MRKVALVVENLKCTDILSFAIGTLQLFRYPENLKISIFPIALSQQKCYIFKSILPIFKKFFWLQDEERGYSG